MNNFYTKTILYAYPVLDSLLEQIDVLVEKKALSSFYDYSPALEQCENIVSLTMQKDIILFVKDVCDKVLNTFSCEDLLYFDYKYFNRKNGVYTFDPASRNYFRKQISLLKRIETKFSYRGLDDEFFKSKCYQIDFFKELLKRVIEKENSSMKNKKARDKKNSETKRFLTQHNGLKIIA